VDALINSSQAFIDYTKQPTEKPTEKTSVFGDYQDLLGTLVLLQQENGVEKFRAEHPELDEREEAILLSLCNVDIRALGYCIKDVTGDGSDELLLLNSGSWIRTIYTLHEGKPVWIKDFCRGGVKDGVLYDETETIDDTMVSRSYRIGNIVNGKYEEKSFFGYSYVFDKYEYQDVFLIENQETIKTDMKTVESKIHAFPGFPHNTREEGVTYTRLFEDGTTVEDEGKHYRITKTNGVYKLEIFDKDGNLAFSKRSLGAIYCRTAVGDTLCFEYSDSYDPHCFFYSVSQNQFSQKFPVTVTKCGELVAYAKTDGDVPLLVVQNIFDKAVFYKEFECPEVPYAATFAPDEKSVEITFSGASGKPGKRVFCFETLPILRVTTICYVRYSTSVYDDVYYISSGNPALLRPANEDTVRLLETLEGGTYKDADGNERNDWHKIVYNGRELYVTADSFEVLTYEVK
jgi:hypothetical protein